MVSGVNQGDPSVYESPPPYSHSGCVLNVCSLLGPVRWVWDVVSRDQQTLWPRGLTLINAGFTRPSSPGHSPQEGQHPPLHRSQQHPNTPDILLGPGHAALPAAASRWQHNPPAGCRSWLQVPASQKRRSLDTRRRDSSLLKSVCVETFVILILGHYPHCACSRLSRLSGFVRIWVGAARTQHPGGSPASRKAGEERGSTLQLVQMSLTRHQSQGGLRPA